MHAVTMYSLSLQYYDFGATKEKNSFAKEYEGFTEISDQFIAEVTNADELSNCFYALKLSRFRKLSSSQ